MNAKLVVASVLAVALLAGGLAVFADSDDSAAQIDDGNTYADTHPGHDEVNFSDLCLVLGVILIIGAVIIVGIAIYTKLYGDF